MKSRISVIVIIATFVLLGSMLPVIPVKAGSILHVPTPQYPNIQTAVNAATPNDKIKVDTGIYHEDVQIFTPKIKISGQNAILEGSQINKTGFEIYTHDVVIEGFIIQNYTDQGILISSSMGAAYGNVIRHNIIRTNCGHGIFIDYSDSNLVQINQVIRNYKNGICIRFGFYNKIRNNPAISSNLWNGIQLGSAARTEVKHNIVMFNGRNGLLADQDSLKCVITTSTFNNNTIHGIWLYSNLNNITSNVVNFNQLDGMMIYGGSNNLVDGNQFNWNKYNGLFIMSRWISVADSNLIQNNNATKNGDYGIFISGDNNKVQCNQANWNGYIGIAVYPSFGPGPSKSLYNTVYNNTANFNGGGGTGTGILILLSDFNLIMNNEIHSNVQQGIYLANADSNTIYDNQISFNGETGISLEIASHNSIYANNIFNNTQDGIHMSRSSSYNLIRNNQICNNTGSGIGIENPSWSNIYENSTFTQIINNTVTHNGKYGFYADCYSYSNTIDHNDFSYNSISGITAYWGPNTITNNSVCNNINWAGIELYGPYNLVEYNQVNGNAFDNIWICSKFNTIMNNTANNSIFFHGIQIDGDYNVVRFNNASYNNRLGIYIVGDYNYVRFNNASCNLRNGIVIYVDSDYNMILNNTASWNGQYGILVQDNAPWEIPEYNLIWGNEALNNGWYDLYYTYNQAVGNDWATSYEPYPNGWSNHYSTWWWPGPGKLPG